jgi:hypothetical protein
MKILNESVEIKSKKLGVVQLVTKFSVFFFNPKVHYRVHK